MLVVIVGNFKSCFFSICCSEFFLLQVVIFVFFGSFKRLVIVSAKILKRKNFVFNVSFNVRMVHRISIKNFLSLNFACQSTCQVPLTYTLWPIWSEINVHKLLHFLTINESVNDYVFARIPGRLTNAKHSLPSSRSFPLSSNSFPTYAHKLELSSFHYFGSLQFFSLRNIASLNENYLE